VEHVVLYGREETCVSVLLDIWKRRQLGKWKFVGKDNIKIELRTDCKGALECIHVARNIVHSEICR
jgi:hypothetical protein